DHARPLGAPGDDAAVGGRDVHPRRLVGRQDRLGERAEPILRQRRGRRLHAGEDHRHGQRHADDAGRRDQHLRLRGADRLGRGPPRAPRPPAPPPPPPPAAPPPPAGPVHAFAFPDTTTTPRARPFFRRAAERSTGSARRRFCVNAPAAAAGPWATTSPMSFFPLGLIPAATPADRNPPTRVLASGLGRRGCGPVALLVLLAATARAGVVAPDLGLGAPHGRHLLRLGGLRRCLLLAALLPLGRVDRHHLPLLQLGQLLFLLPLDAHAEQLLPH